MTRADIEREYKVERGIIRSPGKFEGEAVYVPAFWESGLEGCADRDDGHTFGFDLNADDKRTWPELKGRRTLRLVEDSQGFVSEVRGR